MGWMENYTNILALAKYNYLILFLAKANLYPVY